VLDRNVLKTHREELSRTAAPAYRLFEAIETGDGREQGAPELRRALLRVVESVVADRVRADDRALQCARWAMGLGMPDSLRALTAWGDLIAAARPSRGGIKVALSGFSAWLTPLPPADLPAVLDLLPKLGPCLAELGTAGMVGLMDDVRALRGDTDALAFIGSFGSTTGTILTSAARLARQAETAVRKDLLLRLSSLLPPQQALESSEGEALLPALAAFGAACATKGPGPWAAGIDLAVSIAERNVSSAVGALRALRRRASAAEAPEPYLRAFGDLVRSVGLSVVGFGLSELPRIVSRLGDARTADLVDTVGGVAEAYGPTAARWFLEGRTAVARRALR
jgi:hypothetical protein